MQPTRSPRPIMTPLASIEEGKAAAPFCEPSPPRWCSICEACAVLPLDATTRAKQPDATTHVCHPVLGGCNHGFTVYAEGRAE